MVNAQIAWASGAEGTVLLTVDGGENWRSVGGANFADRDLRDLHAWDERRAVVMGVGAPGIIYATDNQGASWRIQHQDDRPGIFLDAMSFGNASRGLVVGDPIGGHFVILDSNDGGVTWSTTAEQESPSPLSEEAAFAASGTCLAVSAEGQAWWGLGGKTTGGKARLLKSVDYGRTWRPIATPLDSSESAGIFSVLMLEGGRGVLVGGDYRAPKKAENHCAVTEDGGETWFVPKGEPTHGFRSCVAAARLNGRSILVATGSDGCDMSTDLGHSWQETGDRGYHAIAFAPESPRGWAVGADGRIARVEVVVGE